MDVHTVQVKETNTWTDELVLTWNGCTMKVTAASDSLGLESMEAYTDLRTLTLYYRLIPERQYEDVVSDAYPGPHGISPRFNAVGLLLQRNGHKVEDGTPEWVRIGVFRQLTYLISSKNSDRTNCIEMSRRRHSI